MGSDRIVRSVRVTTAIAAVPVLWLAIGSPTAGLLGAGLLILVSAVLAAVLRLTWGTTTRSIAEVLHDVDAEPPPVVAIHATGAVSSPRPPAR